MTQLHSPRKKAFQGWRTPKHIYLNTGIDYDLDAAADSDNAICDRFYDEAANALTRDWVGVNVWLNPPYANPLQGMFVAKAFEQYRKGNVRRVDMLVQANVSSKWWHYCLHNAEVQPYIGRIQFDTPPHMENLKRNNFSSVLVRLGSGQTGIVESRSATTGLIISPDLVTLGR